MKILFKVMKIISVISILLNSNEKGYAFVDLHAHPFLIDQMFWGARPGFTDAPTATSWRERYQTRLTEKNILTSGVQVMVVSFYAHPLFKDSVSKGLRESIRSQIDQLHRFLRQHPGEVEVARSPSDVKRITDQKKLAIVLSIEGAAGIFESSRFDSTTTNGDSNQESDANFEEFIDKEGIRIVTIEHFIDDEFGGAAFFPSWRGFLANPISFSNALWTLLIGNQFTKSSVNDVVDKNGIIVNKNGLSLKGYDLIQRLVKRGIWIDLSHASDKTIENILKIKELAQSPLLFTHTTLRKNFRAERGLSEDFLLKVADNGGLIGLIPSEEMLTEKKFEGSEERHFEDCFGGIKAFQSQWNEITSTIDSRLELVKSADNKKDRSKAKVMLGSDANAPLQFLSNYCMKNMNGSKDLNSISKNGFSTYSDLSVLFKLMSEKNESEVQSFVDVWQNYLDSVQTKKSGR